MFCGVGDLVTYIIVACYYKTSVREPQRVKHSKGWHETVVFVLEFRGVNVVTSTLRIAKFRCGYYCTSNRVFGVALVDDDLLEFRDS